METKVLEPSDALADFIEEALESLCGLPAHLEAYRAAPAVAEPINAVFRAVHSIKGCAGFLGLDAIRTFSHALENTLDTVRTEAVLSNDLEYHLIAGFDRLDALLQEAAGGRVAGELQPEDMRILEAARAAASVSANGPPADAALLAVLGNLVERMDAGTLAIPEATRELRQWLSDCARASNSQEPQVSAPLGRTPDDYRDGQFACGDADVTPEIAGIVGFFLDFAEGRNSPERELAFLANVEGFAALATRAGDTDLEQALQAVAADFRTIHESPLDFDENLLGIVWERLAPALETLKTPEHVKEQAAPDGPPATSSPQPDATRQTHAKARFVRVKEEHLDQFLEHVSRMFITSERFRDVQSRLAQTKQLPELADELRQINMDLKVESTALQQGVMALRRVAIGGMLSKFPRMARELAAQLGKQIHVHLAGEETELDKQLCDDLDAPLAHLVRNVVDHAIEAPSERKAHGKRETGNLHLEARSTGKQVIVLVRDDGRGMDPRRLRMKAVERGILSQADADALSHDDALQLIFHPGFSTAEKVSQVSGRGVGMDVVQATVGQHHGRVAVESVAGKGTNIRMEFPIRQATLVIDGLMVTAGTEPFVIPFDHIKEIVRFDAAHIQSVQASPVVTIRNETYDAVDLKELIGARHEPGSTKESEMGVVVESKRGSMCIRVDSVVGHRQVVVTSITETVPGSTKLAGIAQLGGGRLAPVLNIPDIFNSTA